ncbi:hypothetical protein P3T76_005997 [Phytophthora citrophthora]|uniref:RxLR effector protein n=1 Tax=Phytophthora citrophthora TaxID=4793 RepID=A0AAD9GQQ8_9STRA|nr:hypothetical protein P3T76_005997 [Phytophthora citrophthora]
MRLQFIVVLLLAALVATTHALKFPPSETVDVLPQRFLRRDHTYNDEERGAATLLEKVKRVFPSKITDKTLQRWANDKKSSKQALTRLKLDNSGTNLFEKREFGSWVTFMTKRHPNNPEEAMLSYLMTKYSDGVLTQMIIKAKSAASTTASTKEAVTKMQSEQLRLWAKQGKSSHDVFDFYKLNKVKAKTLDDLVGDPQYSTWAQYVDDISGKDPDKAKSMMAKTLTTYYTDQGLYSMLGAAKNVESTKKLATDLQKAQIANWFANKADPKDVFRWVGASGNSVEKGVWRTYRDNFNAQYIVRL